jgi:lactate racemase
MMAAIRYGRGFVEINVPDDATIVNSLDVKVIDDPKAVLSELLADPTGCPPLQQILAPHNDPEVCVVVSDFTRPLPYQDVLPGLLAHLLEQGVKKERITILIATGMHRASTDDERRELFGDVVDQFRIVDHDSRDADSMVPLPHRTRHGSQVSINKLFYESDVKILVGLIESHFMAGFSGGRKSVCPGLVDLKTIETFHGPDFLENENATNCVLKNNPCHIEASDVALMTKVDFIVNVTINHDRKITGIFAGDLVQAHKVGTDFVRTFTKVKLSQPYDIVVTSGGGYPLDATLYQTGKGMVGALPAVKKGGTIIIASECSEGLGSREFKEELLKYDGRREDFLPDIRKRDKVILDQWGIEMQFKVFQKVSLDGIILCATGIDRDLLPRLSVTSGYQFADSGRIADMVQGALDHTLKKKPDATVAVVPEGPYVVPYIE